jgi:uncharacterized protein
VHPAYTDRTRGSVDGTRHDRSSRRPTVRIEHLVELAKGTPGTGDRTAEYHAELAAWTAARWRGSGHVDPEARESGARSHDDRIAGPGTHPPGQPHRPLSEAELERLSAFLRGLKNPEALSLEGLDGFLCALIAGPDLTMPSEYLPVIWGGNFSDEYAFSSREEANAFLQLLMRHWNSIIAELEKASVYLPLVEAADERGVPGRPWARGFMRAVRLSTSAGWTELYTDESDGSLFTIPVVAGEVDPAWPPEPLSAEKADDLLASMAAGLARAYRHFAADRRAAAQAVRRQDPYRHSARKVGRNDPCPCGSGKKFKHCCRVSAQLGGC